MAHAKVSVSVFVGASVDGFIARKNHALDFLPETPEPHGYDEFIATVDAIVMGRNTYDVVLGFGGDGPFTKPVLVVTRRPFDPPKATPKGAIVEAIAGEPAGIVRRLADRGYRHLYVDGGLTIQSFLRAGLVTRMIVTRVPVLIGDGIPLFGSLPHDVKLNHVATRTYPSGLVQSEYDVVKEGKAS